MAQEKSHLHFCFFTNNKVKVDIDGMKYIINYIMF